MSCRSASSLLTLLETSTSFCHFQSLICRARCLAADVRMSDGIFASSSLVTAAFQDSNAVCAPAFSSFRRADGVALGGSSRAGGEGTEGTSIPISCRSLEQVSARARVSVTSSQEFAAFVGSSLMSPRPSTVRSDHIEPFTVRVTLLPNR